MLGRGGCVQFVTSLKDNLNAEVVLGTVTNVREASAWLGYTYLFVRMLKNPLVYGMSWEEVKSFVFWPSCCLQLILRLLRTRLHSALLFFDVESSVLRADVLCLFTLQKIKVEDSAQ